MRYKNTFINHCLQINVYTNSKRISKLIKNVLDLGNGFYNQKPKIKIDVFLDEINLEDANDDKNFLYQGWLDKNKKQWLSIANKMADVIIDYKKSAVRGMIFNYQESSKEHLLDLIFMQPLRFILAKYGFFFIHTSAVCKDKNYILIAGTQGSGKSTLALTLAQSGFTFLADDDCFIKLKGNQTQLFPFPTKIGLNNKILKKFPKLASLTIKNYHYGQKKRLSSNLICSRSSDISNLKCKMIIFPKYSAKKIIKIKKISKEKALDKLIKGLIKDSPITYTKKTFWAFYNLTKKANSFELTYNDSKLNEIPNIINKIF